MSEKSRPSGAGRTIKEQQVSLAIEGGGSTAKVALCHRGATLVRAVRSGLNPLDVGYREFEKRLRSLLLPLLKPLRDSRIDLCVCAALAGAGEPEVRAECTRILHRVIGPLSASRGIRVLTDLDAMTEYYLSEHDGIVLIAGTGSVCAGLRRRRGRVATARAGGWGGWLDRGSGFRLGLSVLEAALRAYDGIAEESVMVGLLCERHDTDLEGLAGAFLRLKRDRVAQLAGIALEAYSLGDPVARSLVRGAVGDLTDMVLAVKRKAGLDRRFRLVISGGMFHDPVVVRLFRRRIKKALPQTHIHRVTDPLCPILELAKRLTA